MHVLLGLRQALVLLTLSLLASGAAGAVWTGLAGGGLGRRTGLVAMLLSGLVGVSGGTELSRGLTTDARAWLGAGPDREQPATGGHLTAVGVFLFVSVPLFALGGALVWAFG